MYNVLLSVNVLNHFAFTRNTKICVKDKHPDAKIYLSRQIHDIFSSIK